MTVHSPSDMLAIDPDAAGGPEVLRPVRRPVPAPAAGEVLVRVAAAGVNRPDVMQRKGLYPPPPGAPSIPGLEIAGTVVALGEGVDTLSVGAEVAALVSGGGYAEWCTAPAGQCLPIPAGLSMVEAAALPETLFTVWSNLFERAYATAGERVLVHGGTSGIGTMAIKLGGLFGLEVIVTCGSDDKCAAARALGATHAINYRMSDFVEEVAHLTGGEGVHVVLDMVGGDYVPRNLKCLAPDGRHVSIAVQRGARAEISIADVMMRRLTLTGSTLRARPVGFKTLVADEIAREVWPHVADGRLRPEIDRVFPLAEAAEAHRRMEDGDHVGKIVLSVAGQE
ncbi:putative PIG3 family NAD(P)H quinone oxidoreductase [Sphingomonas jejuensis]|uniref:PIG3 family NAD(P)H quinone oxidoreductase n=1 Tax=Sphingomonas jejuensis TaxID=904715 RepID=A0ABX0XIA6_9SPHN|nr:NAD(P)H-quinone oxidoreductase [Sphingomonas jejuensis]NJC33059.1 putative PIG3 family NAD(P)H quinone oxidoreductase [Sphingomonas jejuensis]